MNLIEKSSATIRGRKRQSKRGRPMLRRQFFLLAGRWCQAHGHGHFFIEDTNCRYILPNLVTHYVTAHAYKLPTDVEQALLENRRQVRLW